jgi:uncharacterized protein (DUF362 family)
MEEDIYLDEMNRRKFIKTSVSGLAAISLMGNNILDKPINKTAKIALIKSDHRKEAINTILTMVNFESPQGRDIFIKPNFNTADLFPGSTHNDTLEQIVKEFQGRGSKSLTVGDRSGPQPTEEVLEKKGINKMSKELDFSISNFSNLPEKDWLPFNPKGNHWEKGFLLARPPMEAEYLVTTHCLKTHQYGGVFTLSLKNTVGMAPRSLMRQLHQSPNMRKMITELNIPFTPKLIMMDGIEAFVDGGPMKGTRKKADIFLAGTDRVAMDAVAVAILKELGSNDAIMNKKIFQQEQILRAVELKLGVSHPEEIEFVTGDPASKNYANKIRELLLKG